MSAHEFCYDCNRGPCVCERATAEQVVIDALVQCHEDYSTADRIAELVEENAALAGRLQAAEQMAEKLAVVRQEYAAGRLGGDDVSGTIDDLSAVLAGQDVGARLFLDEALFALQAAADDEASDTDSLVLVAWGLIANAYDGNWSQASEVWRGAAVRWRDDFHAWLDVARESAPDAATLADEATDE